MIERQRRIDTSTAKAVARGMESLSDTDVHRESDESLAARFEISFDGKRYAFRQHRYDIFQDALRYAAAEHAKAGFMPDESFQADWRARYHPSEEEENTMRLHGIAYAGGHYLYAGYRYEQLRDALAFAAGHPNL